MFGKHKLVRTATLSVLVIGSIPEQATAQAQKEITAEEFRWIARAKDKVLWDEIQAIFAGNNSARPVKGGNFSRVGVYSSVALVIEQRNEAPGIPGHLSYQAFNVHLNQKKVEEIFAPGASTMWQWRFVKLAKFSEETVPDIVFRFRDCVDCESTELLAAFRFSKKESRWEFRQWDLKAKPEAGSFLLVGADMDTGETEKGVSVIIKTTCVYKVDDLNGDGVDEVGSWCRVTETEMDTPGRKISKEDTTLLFTAKNRVAQIAEIKDPLIAGELHRKLCLGQERHPLCRSVASILSSGSQAPPKN